MKKDRSILIISLLFMLMLPGVSPFAQPDKHDMVNDMTSDFLTGYFCLDPPVTFIPIIINNATDYEMKMDSMVNPKFKSYAYFPKNIPANSSGYAFLYDVYSDFPCCGMRKDQDNWVQYKFTNEYSTPMVFHMLNLKVSEIKNISIINGIQGGLRSVNGILRIVKAFVPKKIKIILTACNIALTAATISLTIDKLVSNESFFYFLAYPYSPQKYEKPYMNWYSDDSGRMSKNAIHLHSENYIDSGFVVENYIVWDNDKPNYPAYPDTTKYRGYMAPKLVVNIYPHYLYDLSSVMVNAELAKNTLGYTANLKMKKLVDKILETDAEGLDRVYSVSGYEIARKTSKILSESISGGQLVPGTDQELALDELLKAHKIE